MACFRVVSRHANIHRIDHALPSPCLRRGVCVFLAAFLCGCGDRDHSPAPQHGSVKGPAETAPASDRARSATIPALKPRKLRHRAGRKSDWFADVPDAFNVAPVYADGSEGGFYLLLETIGGGAASLDFDRDGDEDLVFTQGGGLSKAHGPETIAIRGRPSRLYRNSGQLPFVDVTHLAGLEDDRHYTHGCTVCDFDADGFDDVVVAGYGGLQLWQNRGDGTFAERAETLGFTSSAWNITPAAADYDGDGLVDLYVVTYADWSPGREQFCPNDQGFRDVCGPTLYEGARDLLFRNTGEGFVNVADEVGLVPENRGLGVVTADFNHDGRIDFAVVNDVQENQLYLNGPDGRFREEGTLWGSAYSPTGEREASMGVEAGDYDGDGFIDLWYTNYALQDNSLLRNLDGTGFVHAAREVGLAGVSWPWVGFGTLLADFDGDGWDDIFIANGHVAYERRDSPYYQPAQLFQSEQGQRFVDVSESGGPYFDIRWSGRGAVKTDWDNDGAWDLVVSHQNEPAALLHNRRAPQSWIKLDLVGAQANRNAIGAEVRYQRGDRTVHLWKVGGGSYCSHSDRRLNPALPDESGPVDILVRWPGGGSETFARLGLKTTHALIEGQGTHAP